MAIQPALDCGVLVDVTAANPHKRQYLRENDAGLILNVILPIAREDRLRHELPGDGTDMFFNASSAFLRFALETVPAIGFTKTSFLTWLRLR